jgi:D-3-phosphoglycerate dehydrogenase
MTHHILVADRIADEGVDYLSGLRGFEVDFAPGLSETELISRIEHYDGLIVRSATQVTRPLIEAAVNLKVIGRAGIGVDNIDVEAATERGMLVLNTPDANATTTAELAVAHILSLSRQLPAADRSVRAGKWERNRFVGTELAGKIAGVIGYGTIGRIVANRLRGLRMKVLAHDPFVTGEVMEEDGVVPATLDEVVSQSDYLTLHCPLVAATRNLINAERIAAMKVGARIINCARGGLIDEQALYQALTDGRLAGAALDVFEHEPPAESSLLTLDNIVLTPHLGASTIEAQLAVGVEIARQVAAFLHDGAATNAVNLPPVSSEVLQRLRPYQGLACRLGRLLTLMLPEPICTMRVCLNGAIADLDIRPIASEALGGLLEGRLSGPLNRVNASHLARRQGIVLEEAVSCESHDYVSTVNVSATSKDKTVEVVGTLFDERHPRLVRVNRYEFESPLEGNLLITQHQDRPGVVGALGEVLGSESINISRMQVGVAPDNDRAIAILAISRPLDDAVMTRIKSIPAIIKAIQLSL